MHSSVRRKVSLRWYAKLLRKLAITVCLNYFWNFQEIFRLKMQQRSLVFCRRMYGDGRKWHRLGDRDRRRERGAPVSLVTPVGNHTLYPMAPDAHAHTRTKPGQWYVGKYSQGETWEGEKLDQRQPKKINMMSLFLSVSILFSDSIALRNTSFLKLWERFQKFKPRYYT